MNNSVSLAPHLDFLDIVLRLGVAAGLAGLVGVEREARDQDAGLRTHILVAMGACLFVIIGNFGWDGLIFGNSSGIVLDPSRVVAYVVTGIGFLGAGAILKFGTTVRGLTTAASLWVTAAIGVTSAAGEYLVAVLATAMILVSLRPLQWFAGRLRKQTPGTCRLVIESQRPVAVSPIIAELRTAGVGVDALTVRDESGGHQATFTLVCEAGELADMVDTLKAKAPTDAAISLTN